MAPVTAVFCVTSFLSLLLWMCGAFALSVAVACIAACGFLCFLGPTATRYLFVTWSHKVAASRALQLHRERHPELYQTAHSGSAADALDEGK